MEQFRTIVNELKDMYERYHEGLKRWENTTVEGTQNLVLPPWLCQPYIRDTPENHIKKVEEKRMEYEERAVSNLNTNVEFFLILLNFFSVIIIHNGQCSYRFFGDYYL